jgi:hypothetical protein
VRRGASSSADKRCHSRISRIPGLQCGMKFIPAPGSATHSGTQKLLLRLLKKRT